MKQDSFCFNKLLDFFNVAMKLSLLNTGNIDRFVDICDNTGMNNQKEFQGY